MLKQTDPLRVKWSDWALMGTFYRQEVHCSRLTHLEAFNSLSSKRLQIQISEHLLILFLLQPPELFSYSIHIMLVLKGIIGTFLWG